MRFSSLHLTGYWRLNQNAFKLKFLKFGLKFRNIGSVSIPDTVLRNLIRNLVTSGVKQIARTILPPELGDYLNKTHEARQKLQILPKNSDEFRFYGKMDVRSEISLETLSFDYGEAIASAKKLQNKIKKLAGKKDSKEQNHLLTICRVLGLDGAQLDLLLRTQLALGLTKDSTFPDESLKALGMKAISALNVQGAIESQDVSLINLDGMLEAAQRLGQKAFAGEFTKSEASSAPLTSLLDLGNVCAQVKYS